MGARLDLSKLKVSSCPESASGQGSPAMPELFDPYPQAASLRKYCEAFDLDVPHTAGKEVLIQAVSRHWGQQASRSPDQPVSSAAAYCACLNMPLCPVEAITLA